MDASTTRRKPMKASPSLTRSVTQLQEEIERRKARDFAQGDFKNIDTASIIAAAEAAKLGDFNPDLRLDDVEYKKFSKFRTCCCKGKCCSCIKSKERQWEPSAHEDVFKSNEVAETKYPRIYKILDLKFWDFLFVFACLASIFLFTFCEGFLIQSRVLWGLIHTVNALYTVLLLLQWVQIILKTKYAQNSFTKVDIIFSLLSVLPVDLIVLLVYSLDTEGNKSEDHMTFTLSRLHYLFRIKNILNYLSNWENQLIIGDFHSFLLRVLLYTAFLLHIFACIWHRLACRSFRPKHFIMEPQRAREELCVPNSWIMKLSERAAAKDFNSTTATPFLHSSGNSQGILWDHYLVSLYWATGTAFRLGYGDVEINIVSDSEVICTAICQIISWIFVLAVVCGTLTSLLIESDTERESYLTRRFAIKHYLKFSKVGKAVVHEVQKFYDYLWSKRKGVSELMLIEFMPAAMKSEIFFDIHKFVLEQMPLFADLDASFLMTLSVRMTHSFHLTGEVLFERNDRGNHMYYVLKGYLEIMSADETHPIACIRSGSAIGDVFLVHPYSHCCTVRCGSECDILALTRTSVKEVLQDYSQYFDVLQQRIQERFDQSVLLLSLASRYSEAHQLFDKLPFEMPAPDIIDNPISLEEEQNKAVRSPTESKMAAYVTDSDGLSIAQSIIDKMPTMFMSALAKKEKKVEKRKKSLQEEAYQAFAGDVNRTCLLAKDLGVGRAPLIVTPPVVIANRETAQKAGDTESGFFSNLLQIALMKGEDSAGIILCWKGFVSFLVCLIIFYYPYQFAFRSSNNGFNVKMNGVAHIADLIFALDCAFDSLQIVVTPQKSLETIPEIMAYRLRTFNFYFRVFAFLPIEYVIVPVIDHTDMNSSPYLYLFKMNRLIEIVVVLGFFQDLEGVTKIPIMAVFLTKFSLALLYVIHTFAVFYEFLLFDMIPFMDGVDANLTKESKWADVQSSYEFVFYWATQVVTTAGFGDVNNSYHFEVFLLCVSFITGSVVTTYLAAKLAAILANAQRRRISFKQTYYGVTAFLKVRKFPDDLSRRIKSYYNMQWKAHEGVLIPKERSAIWDAPDAILNQVSLSQGLRYIGRVAIVKYTSEQVLRETCRALKQYFVPPDECFNRLGLIQVLFEGDKRRELYIIVKGFCNVHRGKDFVGHLTEGNYFGLSGLIMGVNQNYRITTETHCLFFCLQYDDFVQIARTHKFLRKDYKILRGESKFDKYFSLKEDRLKKLQQQQKPAPLPTPDPPVIPAALARYSREIEDMDDSFEVNAEKLEDKIGMESSLNFQIQGKDRKGYQIWRYFLLRRTILPYGMFMICWMTFRVTCAAVISYYVLTQFTFAFDPRDSFYTLLAFDIVAWIDLYLMLHVAYYNHLQQLISDPVKTARHCFKGPFTLDLLFCFPFDYFYMFLTPGIHVQSNVYAGHFRTVAFLRLNRFFQPYKLIQIGNLIGGSIFKSLSFITLVEVLPWTLIFIHFMACLSVLCVCTVSDEGGAFNCSNSAWLTHGTIYLNAQNVADNEYVQNPFKMYLIAFYWTIATALRVGFGDIDMLTTENRLISVAVIIAGTIVTTYISSKLTACMVGEDERRIEIRTKIDIMHSFLDRFKVSRSVRRRVEEIYFNEWEKTAGISVDNLFVALLPSLKADVMCHLYEDSIRQSPLLRTLDEPGIRMLSSILREEFLVEGKKEKMSNPNEENSSARRRCII